MGIIAEEWLLDESVQLTVQRVTGFDRLRGLIARAPLGDRQALLIPRCRRVHSLGMSHAIDVVFVGGSGVVVEVHSLRPARFAGCRSSRDTFEFAGGAARQLGIGRGSRLVKRATVKPEAEA